VRHLDRRKNIPGPHNNNYQWQQNGLLIDRDLDTLQPCSAANNDLVFGID
jgi:hypothetical protein